MTAGRPDYYAVLGVARDAPGDAVRVAYRRLAARAHPDRHQGGADATARFKVIVEAYSVLGDAERRAAYDAGLPLGDPPVERAGGLAEVVGGLVDQLFGVKEGRPEAGRNRVYRLRVAFCDAMTGATQTLVLPVARPCVACDGRGFPPETIPEVCPRCLGTRAVQGRPFLRSTVVTCSTCDGRGYTLPERCSPCAGRGHVASEERLEIPLPPGSASGETLRLRGRGERGRFGGADGDLLVALEVEPHPVLARDGDDVVMTRPVSVFTAILGGEVAVPTVDGERLIRVPPSSPDGASLKMVGFGVARPGGGRGDQRVRLRVELPAALDEAERAAVEAAAERVVVARFPETLAFERDDRG